MGVLTLEQQFSKKFNELVDNCEKLSQAMEELLKHSVEPYEQLADGWAFQDGRYDEKHRYENHAIMLLTSSYENPKWPPITNFFLKNAQLKKMLNFTF